MALKMLASTQAAFTSIVNRTWV